MINILEDLRNGGLATFQLGPENYLQQFIDSGDVHEQVISKIEEFADQAYKQNRVHISQAIKYFRDKFFIAKKLKDSDFFYFIRPFFEQHDKPLFKKQRFLLAFSRILNQFIPPVILKDKVFRTLDKLTTYGEATLLILASYEIFESLKNDKYAKRPAYLKNKYSYPDQSQECDDIATYKIPIDGIVFQIALNEMGLYRIYIDEYKSSSSNL